MTQEETRYYTMLSKAPKGRIPHWEAWSNPDAETYITGIDHYDHPRLCRLKMLELYPELNISVPDNDDPIPRPRMGPGGASSDMEKGTVRWGDGETGSFEHGEKYFKTEEDVFAFDPLAHADMRGDRRKFLGAVAGMVFGDTEKAFAMKNGFYVIEPSGDTFIITAPKGEYSPREW